MNYKFSYKIETLITDNVKRLETHISIDHIGKTTKFYSGLYCNQETHINFERHSFSIDPVHYGFQKCYWFARNWIEIILYDYYIGLLIEPNTNFMKSLKKKIKEDIECLNKFNSFNYAIQAFLLDKFRHITFEPRYCDYEPYHSLLDCMLDFQLKHRIILTKDSTIKYKFFESIKEYPLREYVFNLTKELRIFLKWIIENNIDLIDEHDTRWMFDS